MHTEDILYRPVIPEDILPLALLRAEEPEGQDYWERRIRGYLDGVINPQAALSPRIIYVAVQGETIVGFIAGHLTRRFGCDAELQWVNVVEPYRGTGISTGLFRQLAGWFIAQQAFHICVNCAEDNTPAQKFYRRLGAETLSPHWLVWKDIGRIQ